MNKYILSALLGGASALKVGVMADIHLLPTYNSATSKKNCGGNVIVNPENLF
jgi:hypothetical protein